ncbi:MAG TPA: glycerate kinase, partial [Burkholderiaceae bacterium]
FSRMLRVLQQAAHRPVGHVASAVMLHARLKAGMTLLQVVALARALGEQLSAPQAQPEIYRWTDGGGVRVACTFGGGKLLAWALERPPADDDVPAAGGAA